MHPKDDGSKLAEYTWRVWDIKNNIEKGLVMICKERKPWDRPNVSTPL
jgi:hypothetical protein